MPFTKTVSGQVFLCDGAHHLSNYHWGVLLLWLVTHEHQGFVLLCGLPSTGLSIVADQCYLLKSNKDLQL